MDTVFAGRRRRNLGLQCRARKSLRNKANPLSQGGGACGISDGAIGGQTSPRAQGLVSEGDQSLSAELQRKEVMMGKVAWWLRLRRSVTGMMISFGVKRWTKHKLVVSEG